MLGPDWQYGMWGSPNQTHRWHIKFAQTNFLKWTKRKSVWAVCVYATETALLLIIFESVIVCSCCVFSPNYTELVFLCATEVWLFFVAHGALSTCITAYIFQIEYMSYEKSPANAPQMGCQPSTHLRSPIHCGLYKKSGVGSSTSTDNRSGCMHRNNTIRYCMLKCIMVYSNVSSMCCAGKKKCYSAVFYF